MDGVIQLENKFYIATNSSYADNRTSIINHSDTFGVFDRWGDVNQYGEGIKGIYHQGTRYISESEFRVNGERPLLLSSSVKEENEILSVDLTNKAITGADNQLLLPNGILHIARSKFLRNGSCFEQIIFKNYGAFNLEFSCSLSFHADFADIFEIRGMKRERHGKIFETVHLPDNSIRISYLGLDNVVRTTLISISHVPADFENQSTVVFHRQLPPGESCEIEYSIFFGSGHTNENNSGYDENHRQVETGLSHARKEFAHVFTSNEQLNHWVKRAQSDIISLLARTPYGRYPYAGVPWYNTAFGRDGIITAMQTLWPAPLIARDVLVFLAENQATEFSEFQSAEPGKIVHELRGGEMVETKEIPFKRYYGSVDSTPLFIMLAGAYYDRTADAETIKNIWPHIIAALNWISKYGDIDGDGFVEYNNKSAHGLINQGWKDSQDSVSDEHGNLRPAPIALCEVQAYVYDAKIQAARLARMLNDVALAERLSKEAAALKKLFNEKFWDDELGMYVMALDGEKKPCRIRASNSGHCLFTGIADKQHAARLVTELMSDDMFSGWGIRTLSSREKRYNPMSYHNGSVWPHDVALTASGFARYGYNIEAMQLTAALFDASLFIELQRLPELFCGFQRRRGEGPTAYPVACSPQAWSVGAVYMLIGSCLHMEINALEQRVIFRKPFLPDYMDNIIINGLSLGAGHATIELHRYKDGFGLNIISNTTDWDIILRR
jgi:glycogen debranching enzyme